MKAVILAGGLGKRLRRAVRDRPKSMALVLGKPFLEYQVEQLRKYDVVKIVLCVGYLAEQIKSYFKDGGKFGIDIRYGVEKEPLGTAGALKNAENYLEDEAFLVLNGDSYSEIDITRFVQFHRKKGGMGTILLTRVSQAQDYGLMKIDEDSRITGFLEKSAKISSDNIINAGIYLLEPEVLSYIPEGKQVSLERETFPRLLQKKVPLFGYLTSDYFIDIGTPQKYAQIQKEMKGIIRCS